MHAAYRFGWRKTTSSESVGDGSEKHKKIRPQTSVLDLVLHLYVTFAEQTINGAPVLLKVSVGHRLFLLVALQTTIATLLVMTAMKYLSSIAADNQYMYRFQLLSVADLGKAQEQAAMLQTLTRPDVSE